LAELECRPARDPDQETTRLFRKEPIFARAVKVLCTAAVLAVGLSVQVLADETFFGLVTKVYRANGKIGVQLLDNATAGLSGAVIDLDVLDGLPFDEVEPGDRLKLNVEQIGGVWTITRFQRQ
jgi:hypothetical protein